MKVSPRACRHCKSPARHNPCWWWLDHEYNFEGDVLDYTAPCDFDREREQARQRERRWWFWFWVTLIPCVGFLAYVYGKLVWSFFAP